jgi:hypothetical protein
MNRALIIGSGYGCYVAVVAYTYGRQRRWSGLCGWALLVGGLLLAFCGAGDLFAWAGLLWSFIAAFGGLLIVTDLVQTRLHRR